MAQTAKLFWSGRSQAVRLPKEFRLAGNEVRIRKQGAAVILEPSPPTGSGLTTSPASSLRGLPPRRTLVYLVAMASGGAVMLVLVLLRATM